MNQGTARAEHDPAKPSHAAWRHHADAGAWADATLARLRPWGLLEAVENSAFEARLEARGGTGVGHVWRVLQGMPPGLELEWSNSCLEWGAFTPIGEVDTGLPAPRLRGVSGMVASWRQPGIFWLHDDLDSPVPCVYAIDESGRHRQTYVLEVVPE